MNKPNVRSMIFNELETNRGSNLEKLRREQTSERKHELSTLRKNKQRILSQGLKGCEIRVKSDGEKATYYISPNADVRPTDFNVYRASCCIRRGNLVLTRGAIHAHKKIASQNLTSFGKRINYKEMVESDVIRVLREILTTPSLWIVGSGKTPEKDELIKGAFIALVCLLIVSIPLSFMLWDGTINKSGIWRLIFVITTLGISMVGSMMGTILYHAVKLNCYRFMWRTVFGQKQNRELD